jgi:HNH endonuclease
MIIRTCKKCGCTQKDACVSATAGNCYWQLKDICSHCANKIADAKRASTNEFIRSKFYLNINEIQFIKNNIASQSIKQIAKQLHRSSNTIRLAAHANGCTEILEAKKKVTQFAKGNASFNKGKRQTDYMSPDAIERTKASRFKPGNIPYNTYGADGVIATRKDAKGKLHQFIRIGMGKWIALGTYNWEQTNGKVPKGYCLWHKDNNTLNNSLPNLELITRSENMARNTIVNIPAEIIPTIKLINKIKKQIKSNEKQNNRS